jgi:hypothetical protein
MQLAFLCVSLVLLIGILIVLLYVARYQWDNRRPVIIAMVLSGILIVMFGIAVALTLVSGPRLEIAVPVKSNPGLGSAYVSVLVTNKGDVIANGCTGEITIDGLNKEPVKMAWAGNHESADIVAGGGSGRLYFLVADPDKIPALVIPYYTGAFNPPRTDDPWLLKPGDYTLRLVIRSENGKPQSAEYALHVGQKWDDLSCTLK